MQRAIDQLRALCFAPPLPVADALRYVRARWALDLSAARVRSGFSRGHLLEVVVLIPGGDGQAREQDAAQDLVCALIGEELFERWVGRVSVAPAPRASKLAVLNDNPHERGAFPIASLAPVLIRAVSELKAGLQSPAQLSGPMRKEWLLFELTPEPAADYGAQDDLLMSSTCLPEAKKSFLRGEPFFSGRFANSGELFVYLKYEATTLSWDARLAERALFEAAVDGALRPEQGCLTGLGLGLRYAYLDLALSDPDSVEGSVLPALRGAGITTRAWLLFCDSELERHWLPVYEGGSEPFWG